MELCERGSLRKVLFDAKITYKLPTVYFWIDHLFSALQYLQQRDPSIIHRDLKPENFLLKVGDFGCAREKSTKNGSHVGTARYMSPEVASEKGVSCKSDVYSAGLILWEIVNRRMILKEYICGSSFREETFQNEFKSGVFKFQPPNCSDDVLKELFLSCVEYNPEDRPSSGEVLTKIASRIADIAATDYLPIVVEENKILINLIAPIDPDLNDSFLNIPSAFTAIESSNGKEIEEKSSNIKESSFIKSSESERVDLILDHQRRQSKTILSMEIMESLKNVELKTKDTLSSCHPMLVEIKRQVANFSKLLVEFNSFVVTRGSDEASREIFRDLLNLLEKWIERKEQDVSMLNDLIEQLGNKKNNLKSITIAVKHSDVNKGSMREFIPPAMPGKCLVKIKTNDENTGVIVRLEWEKPKEGAENVIAYKVQYRVDTEAWQLELKKVYAFRICSMSEAGASEFKDVSDLVLIVDPDAKSDVWVEVYHRSPFPAHSVRGLNRELKDAEDPSKNGYVALWYDGEGKAFFGRAENRGGYVEAWFPKETTKRTNWILWPVYAQTRGEWRSNDLLTGKFQILTNPSNVVYRWVRPYQLDDPRNVLISFQAGISQFF
ncbi:unnamed protein product, partial [Mesorhabditis belari]|uniref:non-specific serine/threonine protein kinase n=1 Tax=Mesorhabditis belari TaxID=2138241 RepID=A0AAF3EAP1_9BILA